MSKKLIDLDLLSRFKDKLDVELETKANVDGNYPTLTAGLADNLTPYSEDSGAEQENPFISNGTGTNNNTEIVTVGDYGLLKEKQGNSVVVNQISKELNSTNWSGSNASVSFSDGVATMTATQQYGFVNCSTSVSQVAGHKYLLTLVIKPTSNLSSGDLSFVLNNAIREIGISQTPAMSSGTWNIVFGIGTSQEVGTRNYLRLYDNRSGSLDAIQFKKPIVTDLTQMFGSNDNIPSDLLSHPDHFSWYYNGSLAYNTGTLDNSNGRYLVCGGRNQFDKSTSVVGKKLASDGTDYIAVDNSHSDYIRVIPNTTYYAKQILGGASSSTNICYYDKEKVFIKKEQLGLSGDYNGTVVTPENCFFVRIDYLTVWVDEVTFSLYYTPEQGGEGYNNYYPYEEPYIVDTGTEVLRKAGSVEDYKEPNGTIHRLVGVVDLGTLDWGYNQDVPWFYAILSDINTTNNEQMLSCSKYVSVKANEAIAGTIIKRLSNSDVIVIFGTAYTDAATFKSAMSGVYLFYELATPTTEQGTPFAENLPINDYGMLYWLDSSNNLVGIPQGCKIFFPTNYKGFVDDMYSRVNGDSSAYVIQSELSASETQRDTVDTILQNAIGGTLRQCLCVKESLDFENTDVLDLSTLSWAYAGSGTFYIANMDTIIQFPSQNTDSAKMICTKYKTVSYIGQTNKTVSVSWQSAAVKYLYVIDDTYSDVDTFKNAMKGVLLAYEKA